MSCNRFLVHWRAIKHCCAFVWCLMSPSQENSKIKIKAALPKEIPFHPLRAAFCQSSEIMCCFVFFWHSLHLFKVHKIAVQHFHIRKISGVQRDSRCIWQGVWFSCVTEVAVLVLGHCFHIGFLPGGGGSRKRFMISRSSDL